MKNNTYNGEIFICKNHRYREVSKKEDKILKFEETSYLGDPKVAPYKKTTLVKLKDGCYVDLENIKNVLDYLKMKLSNNKIAVKNTTMGTSPIYEECLFVNEASLKEEKKSIYQLRKELKKK